jgi:hypothetical protein
VLLTLYKDMKAIGFNTLYGKVKKWHNISSSTFHHNIKKI